ncbi:B- and T-lymphocyte attenuator-like isoform X2 [Cololabis saira]|uniref:B- and T-lymphocyte attenuator-like isoform X2 n=1 Tax=Cololabis saira TaxID=129043 RepID=UPI002AD2D28C|nr:B- and T-lymphocyte attenuator-like isoform X2 [Cololabis saira]
MTGGLLGGCIMRPNHRWTPLDVSILALLFLTLNADTGEDSGCSSEIKVRRNTEYKAVLGEDFRIECPVAFCNAAPPEVRWYKDEISGRHAINSSDGHTEVEWKHENESAGKSYLIFRNIQKNDEGFYWCQMPDTVGHKIKVSVNEDQPESPENVWLYLYCGAGIVLFVIIAIIISVISMRGCKGKSKERIQTENQYETIGMIEQPFSHANLHPSPRGSPCVLPPRRSTKRKSPSRHPNGLRSSRDSEQLSEQMKEDRVKAAEVEYGSVVYAALNHDVPQRPAARALRPMDATSEYAAIRVL